MFLLWTCFFSPTNVIWNRFEKAWILSNIFSNLIIHRILARFITQSCLPLTPINLTATPEWCYCISWVWEMTSWNLKVIPEFYLKFFDGMLLGYDPAQRQDRWCLSPWEVAGGSAGHLRTRDILGLYSFWFLVHGLSIAEMVITTILVDSGEEILSG